MTTVKPILRDERTVAVENAGYKWAYISVVYALFLDVMWRGAMRHEAAWDLLAMPIVGGAICAVYQFRRKTMAQGWVKQALFVALVAAIIGAVMVAAIQMLKFR